ncbi:hypothetical protein ABPG74_018594 [Tetrahymena malaccensis]
MNSQCLGTHEYDSETQTCVLKTWFKPVFPTITVITCIILISYLVFFVTEKLFQRKFKKEEMNREINDKKLNEELKLKYQHLNQRNSQQSVDEQPIRQQSSQQINLQQRNIISEEQEKDEGQLSSKLIQN